MYIMVYKSSNYKQWPGIVFWYSQIQNPVQPPPPQKKKKKKKHT